jgi:hypothetical protein
MDKPFAEALRLVTTTMQVCMSLDGTRVSMVEAFFSLPNTFQRKG